MRSSPDSNGAGPEPAPTEEVILSSNPFSLTSPGFRHGDIRIRIRRRARTPLVSRSTARRGLEHGSSGGRGGVIDGTDFQVAISGLPELVRGGGGDLSAEDLEEEMEEIIRWWLSFGLESGTLFAHHHPTENHTRPEPSAAEENITAPPEEPPPPRARKQDNNHHHHHRTAAAQQRPRRRRQHSPASLPTSPMQDLDPDHISAVGPGGSFVPMGANLSHDLRDFLTWRARYVETRLGYDALRNP